MKKHEARSRKSEDRGRKTEDGRQETEDRRPKSGAGRQETEETNAKMRECKNAGMKRKSKTGPGLEQPATSNQPPIASIGAVTRKNSTVFHKSQSQTGSPSADGNNPKGKGKKRLTPVIIDLPEELAIRACDLLRFFNN